MQKEIHPTFLTLFPAYLYLNAPMSPREVAGKIRKKIRIKLIFFIFWLDKLNFLHYYRVWQLKSENDRLM